MAWEVVHACHGVVYWRGVMGMCALDSCPLFSGATWNGRKRNDGLALHLVGLGPAPALPLFRAGSHGGWPTQEEPSNQREALCLVFFSDINFF
jgi:hypothetical protein